MGTRSLTRVNTEQGKIINLYRQFDGYPSGHGLELFKFLDGFEIVNGISGKEGPKAANGAFCLAAQLVVSFKQEIGGFYLYPVDTTDCGQDYEYVITVKEAAWDKNEPGSMQVEVIGYEGTEFTGPVKEFGEFCNKTDEEE